MDIKDKVTVCAVFVASFHLFLVFLNEQAIDTLKGCTWLHNTCIVCSFPSQLLCS